MRKLCKILFSRYMIASLTILASLALIFALILYAYTYSILIYSLLLVLNFLVVISIINKEAPPEYKIPWLVVTMLVPLFGSALYLIFYSRKLSRKEARLLRKIHVEAQIAADSMHAAEKKRNLSATTEFHTPASGKVRSILYDDPIADIYSGTHSEFFALGEEMFESMIKDIESAEKYIFLEYFIVHEGEMWDRILATLRRKAMQGVDVRLLYDDIGCMKTLPANYPKRLAQDGIKCCRFAKVTPRVSVVHNNRDHRKICVVDGRVAYTGGINIADEYINLIDRFGHWKDGGIKVEGCAALGFVKLFLSMWDLTTGSVSNYSAYFDEYPSEQPDGDGGYYIPYGSGPAPIYSRPVGKNILLNLINQAQKYVYITTPYLIIDYALTEALKGAAQRGVDVRIITPSKADKKIVKVMTKSAYPALIESGVKIYEYQPGFIHEKICAVDDLYATVSTINLDFRSLAHHYEDGVWMYNTPTVHQIRESFLKTVDFCDERDEKEAKLTLFEKLVKNMIRLFAPLL